MKKESFEIGKAIKILRIKSDLSQNDFAKQLNISQSYLSQIENGNKMAEINLLKDISTKLNISLALLVLYAMNFDELTNVGKEELDDFKRIQRKARVLVEEQLVFPK